MAKEAKAKNNKPSKVNKEQESGRVMAILKKEYAFENWLLAILAPLLILYGVYIITGSFGDNAIATYNDAGLAVSGAGASGRAFIDFFFLYKWRAVLTGTFLIVIGVLVLVYLFIPYIRPSLTELKKVSWPSSKTLATNSLQVFAFLIGLSLVFVIYSLVLTPLFQWIQSL